MKKLKKTMILLLSTMLFLMTSASVFAVDNNVTELSDDIYLQKTEKMFNKVSLEELNNSSYKNQFTNMIKNLSNEQFDKFISDLVNTENDISDFREKLNMVGVEITDINREGFIETRGVTSNNANLSAYIAKRGSDKFYRIYSYNSLKTCSIPLFVLIIMTNPLHSAFFAIIYTKHIAITFKSRTTLIHIKIIINNKNSRKYIV